jgi:hypothetical protein
MKKLIKRGLKAAARATGATRANDDGEPIKARKTRLTISGIVVAVLVDLGLDTHIAETLVDLLIAILG